MIISFPILGNFSSIISSSIFSWSFFFSSRSGTPMTQILRHFTLSQRSLRLSTFLLICFIFFLCFIYLYQKWQPTPEFLPGKSHAWRSPVGYCPRGRRESDTTEQFHDHYSLSIFYLTYPVFCLCYSTVCSLQNVLNSFIVLFIIY